ncbi:hypothetical protein ACOI22_14725 [Glaciecola sp. 2405UD65-10]|uniref:hypothetical protein n=1 Tax=Glaciecola sp. 2405UD65-10 TaxID=3397244 RepID=UPI003B5C38F6
MSRNIKHLTLIFSLFFLYVQVAESALLRSVGRGSLSANYSEEFYLVENQYVNDQGIMASAMNIGFENTPLPNISLSNAVGGGGRGLGAVPNECIVGYTQDEVEAAEFELDAAIVAFQQDPANNGLSPQEYDDAIAAIEAQGEAAILAITQGEPCVWEFTQGDPLSLFGFSSLYFDSPNVNYEVKWYIDGLASPLAGAVNTAGDLPTPGGTIENGWITLDTGPFSSLAPGEYNVYSTLEIITQGSTLFYTSTDPNGPVTLEENCVENPAFIEWLDAGQIGPQPEEFFCGYSSMIDNGNSFISVGTPNLFVSESETIRILAANIANPVNSPAPFGLLILGLGLTMLRTKKK